MKQTPHMEFLEAFKNLEDVLASRGFTRQTSGKGLVAQYEDTLEPESDIRKGLQQCRIIRNGYQHENRVLFTPTEDAIKLLKDLVKCLDDRVYTKDVAKKPKKVLDTDKIDTLTSKDIDFIVNGGVLPILTGSNEYIGGIDEHTLIRMLTCGRKVQIKSLLFDNKIKDSTKKAALSVSDNVLCSTLSDHTAYVVIDAKGKYKGMIQKSAK